MSVCETFEYPNLMVALELIHHTTIRHPLGQHLKATSLSFLVLSLSCILLFPIILKFNDNNGVHVCSDRPNLEITVTDALCVCLSSERTTTPAQPAKNRFEFNVRF